MYIGINNKLQYTRISLGAHEVQFQFQVGQLNMGVMCLQPLKANLVTNTLGIKHM